MNITEAKEILSKHVLMLKKYSYANLKKFMNRDQYTIREFTGLSGKNYRIDIQASWADKKEGDLRVRTFIDCRDLSYFFPLSEEFILTRYGGFVGDKKSTPIVKFRFPQWIFNATASLRDFDFTMRNITNLLVVFIAILGFVIFFGYFSSRHTIHGEGEEYIYASGAKHGLYLPIYSFRKAYSRWPLDKSELQDFVTKNKLDISLNPYQSLIFKQNKDGSLKVTYSFKAVSGIENGFFELNAP